MSAREPLNNSTRSAFLPQKPQIVWCDPSDSSRSYDRGAQRARCGFCGETLTGRAFAGDPLDFGSLIWNDQTTLAEATPGHPAKARATAPLQGYLPCGQTALAFTPALSRPRRVIQRLPKSWLLLVRSAPAEPNSREMLELVLAGATLGISLNVVFAGPGRGHLCGPDAAPWRQLIDFGMAGLWCLDGDGLAPDISIDARMLDEAGFGQLSSQAQGILEL